MPIQIQPGAPNKTQVLGKRKLGDDYFGHDPVSYARGTFETGMAYSRRGTIEFEVQRSDGQHGTTHEVTVVRKGGSQGRAIIEVSIDPRLTTAGVVESTTYPDTIIHGFSAFNGDVFIPNKVIEFASGETIKTIKIDIPYKTTITSIQPTIHNKKIEYQNRWTQIRSLWSGYSWCVQDRRDFDYYVYALPTSNAYNMQYWIDEGVVSKDFSFQQYLHRGSACESTAGPAGATFSIEKPVDVISTGLQDPLPLTTGKGEMHHLNYGVVANVVNAWGQIAVSATNTATYSANAIVKAYYRGCIDHTNKRIGIAISLSATPVNDDVKIGDQFNHEVRLNRSAPYIVDDQNNAIRGNIYSSSSQWHLGTIDTNSPRDIAASLFGPLQVTGSSVNAGDDVEFLGLSAGGQVIPGATVKTGGTVVSPTPPAIVMDPLITSTTFSVVSLSSGSFDTISFTFKNTGTTGTPSVNSASITSDSTITILSGAPLTLSAGESKDIVAKYKPLAANTVSNGLLTVKTSLGDTFYVQLTGSSIA